MLDHIHIENFRLFKNLDIPKVGRVNLITGKNNSGKTTLLEALRLWANRKNLSYFFDYTLQYIFSSRGEVDGDPQEWVKTLFHNQEFKTTIEINNSVFISYKDVNGINLVIKTENEREYEFRVHSPKNPMKEIVGVPYIPASFDLVNAILWNKIDLTDKEDKVAEVLRIIEPNIKRVSVDTAKNTAKVRLANSPKPLPLKNFGEGMNRLLTVALGLVSAENDMLLIDEIDLGLHHSVQRLLWEIVFQKSKDLNVQVFATTHSSDCVQAFSDVANKPEYVGMGNYIRLQRKKDGDIVAVDYEMEELESAMDLNLETR